MTHRHKTQTDEHERRKAEASEWLNEYIYQETGERTDCRITDSNHGSRTDSTSKGGKT